MEFMKNQNLSSLCVELMITFQIFLLFFSFIRMRPCQDNVILELRLSYFCLSFFSLRQKHLRKPFMPLGTVEYIELQFDVVHCIFAV